MSKVNVHLGKFRRYFKTGRRNLYISTQRNRDTTMADKMSMSMSLFMSVSMDPDMDRDMDVDMDMGRFLQLNISSQCFLTLNIMSHSAFITFNIISSQHFFPFNTMSHSVFTTFNIMFFHHFVPFNVLSFRPLLLDVFPVDLLSEIGSVYSSLRLWWQ